jgi:hypothetical protein
VTPDLPPSTPLGETAAADASVAQATETRHHAHSAGNTHCLNCGAKLTGPYCAACGQHDFDFHRSFGHVFLEALENIFHFDGKFFRNIVTLLFRPGRLTADFNAGRRASQVPPFRLYIFTAFFFFVLIHFTSDKPKAVQLNPAPNPAAGFTLDGLPVTLEQVRRAAGDPAYAEQLRAELRAAAEKAVVPDAATRRPANTPQFRIAPSTKPAAERNDIERWADDLARRASQPGFQRELSERFLAALPKMLLFCLPIFALITRVLYRKSGQVYLQHLIIALHFHTFIFLWVMFRDGWTGVLGQLSLPTLRGWAAFAGNMWMFVYPLLMLRHLFGQSWPRTFFKTVLLGLGYGFTLAVGFVITALILILML